MILLKIVLLQVFWFIAVCYGKVLGSVVLVTASLILVGFNYFIYKPKMTLGRYFFLGGFFLIAGYVNDSSLIWLGLVKKESYLYGNLSLWIVFLVYYEEIFTKFNKLSTMWISLIGGVSGALTYMSAAKLGAIMINEEFKNQFIWSQLIFWAFFFPLSLKVYFSKNYWNLFLDKTIIFSFDRSGFLRHQEDFNEDLKAKKIKGKTILVTGATAGIGEETASSLANLGARIIITGRSPQKGKNFENKNPNSLFISLDMADWKEVYEFAKSCDPFDDVVFNAGSMPEELIHNNHGIEFQCASQLLGHYFLLHWLSEFQKLKSGARVVWVSSGGMYLKKLDLSALFNNNNYDKVDTYANVKRAQVTLVEELARSLDWSDINIYSMHPGWVATAGLKDALPKFYQLMKNRLRSTQEGADTILWCLLSEESLVSGGFYFDRKKVSPYISAKYIPSSSDRASLMQTLNDKLTSLQYFK